MPPGYFAGGHAGGCPTPDAVFATAAIAPAGVAAARLGNDVFKPAKPSELPSLDWAVLEAYVKAGKLDKAGTAAKASGATATEHGASAAAHINDAVGRVRVRDGLCAWCGCACARARVGPCVHASGPHVCVWARVGD